MESQTVSLPGGAEETYKSMGRTLLKRDEGSSMMFDFSEIPGLI